MNELLDAALAYAARGWAVFPLVPGDKLPVISQKKGGRGVYDATTDPKQIRDWWEQWPDANIGIAAEASKLLEVDVDNKNGRDGFTSWEVVRHTHGSFDDTTPHVWTPNGGKHLYFRADGETLRNTNDELGPGIETKANGAYLVAPPSRLADGRTYTWDERLGLDRVELAPVPEPLRRLLAPKVKPEKPVKTAPAARVIRQTHGDGYGAAALRDELEHLSRATEGTRNNTLNTAALHLGELVAGGELARGEVEQALLDVALRIGLGEREAVATIKSGLDAGARNPRTAPELQNGAPAILDGLPVLEETERGVVAIITDLSECPPLPEDVQIAPTLAAGASPWLDAYERYSSWRSPESYAGYHVNCGLGVLATVAAGRVRYLFGGDRHTSLMLGNVGRSSIWAKSTTQRVSIDVLHAADLDFLRVADNTTPQALVARMAASGVPDTWGELLPEMQEWVKSRLAFAGQQGWLPDEFGGHIAGMMRSDGPMSDFVSLLRVLDDGLPQYASDTISRGAAVIKKPYLALLVSFTPADVVKFAGHGGALWGNGFWARFAFSVPPVGARAISARFPEGDCQPPADLVQPLRQWHEGLGLPDVQVVERVGDDGGPLKKRIFDTIIIPARGVVCRIGYGVLDAVYRYRNALRQLTEGFSTTDFDGNYARFHEKALRVAALLAAFENGGGIELRHWARGQMIAEEWRAGLHNLYAAVNSGDVSPEVRAEEKVLSVLRRHGPLTPTRVHDFIPSLTNGDVVGILVELTKAGAAEIVGTTRKGSRVYKAIE